MKNIFKTRGDLSSISTIISLSLVLFVMGILSLLLINAKQFTDETKEKGIVFTIMLYDSNENASEEILSNQRKKFKKYLEDSDYFVDVTFIDKEDALKETLVSDGDTNLYSQVKDMNLSIELDSYDARVKAKFLNTNGLKEIENFIKHYESENSSFSEDNLVKDIFYQKTMLEKINSTIQKGSLFLLVFCVILSLISFALINNAIRISIYSKRLLIRTMRLVGATNVFIQKPYLIISIYQGFFSSVIAIFMLIGSIEMIKEIFPEIIQSNDSMEIAVIFGLILIFGIIISWISTFFAVRRYLRLNENDLFN